MTPELQLKGKRIPISSKNMNKNTEALIQIFLSSASQAVG